MPTLDRAIACMRTRDLPVLRAATDTEVHQSEHKNSAGFPTPIGKI